MEMRVKVVEESRSLNGMGRHEWSRKGKSRWLVLDLKSEILKSQTFKQAVILLLDLNLNRASNPSVKNLISSNPSIYALMRIKKSGTVSTNHQQESSVMIDWGEWVSESDDLLLQNFKHFRAHPSTRLSVTLLIIIIIIRVLDWSLSQILKKKSKEERGLIKKRKKAYLKNQIGVEVETA